MGIHSFICIRQYSSYYARIGRDPDFCELNIQFTLDVVQGADNLKLFPPFLRPYVHVSLLSANRRSSRLGSDTSASLEWPNTLSPTFLLASRGV